MVNLQQQFRPESSPILQSRSPRIIIVDNDKILCEKISRVFWKSGFNHKIYHQVDDIMPIAENFNPDLVLTEYLLPWLTGGELCTRLRMQRHTCEIPVIMYSSFPKVLIPSNACDAFLQKPFTINTLLRTVNCFLKDCSQLRQHARVSPRFNLN